MTRHAALKVAWPPLVLVFGGGRWARVIARVLLDIVPATTAIRLLSRAGADDLGRWIVAEGLEGRLACVAREDVAISGGDVVIVANAAASHAESVLWALERGAAVLVEKPMALSLAEARHLADQAERLGLLLAPALVFRFAAYLHDFARTVVSRGPVTNIELMWADASGEQRYGEVKRYDAGVSVIEDCLPHAVSILCSVLRVNLTLASLETRRGGAEVELVLSADALACRVILARNAPERRRFIRATGPLGTTELDFTVEPGVVWIDGKTQEVPAAWAEKRPLASMIRSFLAVASGAAPDPRLSLEPALRAAELTDRARVLYRRVLARQLAEGMSEADEIYALDEQLQRDGRLAPDPLNRAREYLRLQLSRGIANGGWNAIADAANAARSRVVRDRPA